MRGELFVCELDVDQPNAKTLETGVLFQYVIVQSFGDEVIARQMQLIIIGNRKMPWRLWRASSTDDSPCRA